MNAPLRRVGVVVMILFGLLFANLNWVQGYQADSYRTNDLNGRVQVAEYERQRGTVFLAAGGLVLAQSRSTDGELKFLRTYPGKAPYAHIVGYKPVNGAATGIEKLENPFLSGASDKLVVDRVRDMFTGSTTPGGNVQLTISKAAQEAAVRELANNQVDAARGAVVALDPRTGALLAMVSMPSFDPNPLASHDSNAAEAAYQKLEADKTGKPLLNRAIQETFPPGSTFKVLVAAAALQNGLNDGSVLAGGASYTPPETTTPIRNAPGVNCPGSLTLKQALTISCNTAFARLGAEQLGTDKVKAMAQAFGFETEPAFVDDEDNAFRVVPSRTGDIKDPDGTDDRAALAQSCIGQANVRMTPLQGALVAAAVANNGRQMRPYLVQQRQGPDLTVLDTAQPRELGRPISEPVAGTLQEMMVSVVENGTGRSARIDGFDVGGKTGTAQVGETGKDHGWFIGFVRRGNEPIAAVAVFLENAGSGGSAEAARIAGQVMRAVIGERGLR
ncbi:MAG TPA: penicillin-binding transpeptidase domain-containing protein [Micromonosporaceae bacterium]|nr:penicillin-binding transpeptidase domain-containing protein [Micromonosporaceae bacterium]